MSGAEQISKLDAGRLVLRLRKLLFPTTANHVFESILCDEDDPNELEREAKAAQSFSMSHFQILSIDRVVRCVL